MERFGDGFQWDWQTKILIMMMMGVCLAFVYTLYTKDIMTLVFG